VIGVCRQDYLPRVPTLSNMMGDVNHNNASEAGHGLKLSERMEFAAEATRNFYWKIILFPHREKTMVPLPSVPAFVPSPHLSPHLSFPHLSRSRIWMGMKTLLRRGHLPARSSQRNRRIVYR
jgi:hypothetical protein